MRTFCLPTNRLRSLTSHPSPLFALEPLFHQRARTAGWLALVSSFVCDFTQSLAFVAKRRIYFQTANCGHFHYADANAKVLNYVVDRIRAMMRFARATGKRVKNYSLQKSLV